MTDGDFIESPQGDDYRDAAAYALAARDYEQAARMISAALTMAPENEGYLALLNQLVDNADEPLKLFDVRRDPFFGCVAVRARLLATRGQLAEALALIGQVVAFRPSIPYLRWVPGWFLAHPEVRVWSHTTHAAIWHKVLSALAPPFQPEDDRLPNAQAATRILSMLAERHPEAGDLLSLEAHWLRRMGQLERALEVATEADSRNSSSDSQVLLGQLLYYADRLDRSIECFENATKLAPKNSAIWLDLGDRCLEAGKVSNAISAFRQALNLDDCLHWARASLQYIEVLEEAKVESLDSLRELALRNPEVAGLLLDAELVSSRLGVPRTPGALVLLDFCHRLEQDKRDQPHARLKLHLSRAEPPSLWRAFSLSMETLGKRDAQVDVTLDKPGSPCLDSSLPLLWTEEDSHPSPCLPQPLPETVESLAAIARSPYHLEGYLEEAKRISLSAEELARCAVHGPLRQVQGSPSAWLFRFQLAALLPLANGRDAWVGSSQSRWLYRLAAGRVDWLSAAAMITLAVVAERDSQARPLIESWFESWLKASPLEEPYCYEPYLLASWMRLANRNRDLSGELWRRRLALRNTDSSFLDL